jgi:amino acid transporter
MFISVLGIAFLYLCMNWSIGSVISWQEVKAWQDSGQNEFIVSVFFERIYGTTAANVATILILWVALASLFAVMLGYSRVPFAAAQDGIFFKWFARLHPTRDFPHVSLLVLASLAFVFSLLFRMSDIISGILAMRILIQFIGQAIGVWVLRRRHGTANLPYRMPFFPLPVLAAIALWLFVFYSTGLAVIGYFLLVFGTGLIVYLLLARTNRFYPFNKTY